MILAKLTVGSFAALLISVSPAAQSLRTAQVDASLGKVDDAIGVLQAEPRDAAGQSLLCSLYSSIDDLDAAIVACEAAVAAMPSSSSYNLQLARAYGAKAEHSGALSGMKLVSRIRGGFQRAVQLDAKNAEALSDLGEFYVEAPAIVGGSVEKARALLPQLQAVSPARGHRLAAMIATKNKDDAAAEREFQEELNTAQSAEAYVDLANFYLTRKRPADAAKFAKLAMDHDPQHGPDTLDAAKILHSTGLDAAAVRSGLRAYLNAPKLGVANYARAHVLLGDSLRANGDAVGAQTEYKAALAVAHTYATAQQRLAR